jgi:glycosyltransferase involved in cell wall biosynthesis|tara:strand:+ start:438 stop:644 length:207 start_codon:yes stop_codon:yes gene_type:complete
MESNILVTVLINCRNEEKLISRAIKSVLFQNYKNIEVIIWDDASSDSTSEIIQTFKDKRINFLRTQTI